MSTLQTRRVAVVVPVSNRPELTPSEQISLRHLRRHLGRYDKFLVAPEGLPLALPGFESKPFPPEFFGSAENYKRMVLSRRFYEAFADYEYILTYHLDALVFSDQLLEWCDRGYDLIGPPWVAHPDSPNHGTVYEGKVGNTGFCLKRVRAFLDLFDSRQLALPPLQRWRHDRPRMSRARKVLELPLVLRYVSPRVNGIDWELAGWPVSEERFLVTRAGHYLPGYRVAPLDDALRFAFETVPRHCFELNDHQLPFGCHAWERYDRAFWEPFLLPDDEAAVVTSRLAGAGSSA